ncbi:calcium-translocating P-type ATPase [Colletotrichum karsti]|uniref:Calcium-transporting ATPase n=1 Tax=Colletotrichum karsti TaxID=1095194 RepID=A0A9P6LMW8_9PEZI|nr:calcium-translocating P-type ATPase [Colletotrichum karsti]KAF9878880.1 calcium-translocating P-type ATPase [Colletotrichum karsti]
MAGGHSPVRRPRAPTITLDTSAVNDQDQHENISSSSPSSDNGDEVNNTLSVPTRKSRSQSWDSNNTTLAKSKTNDGTDKGSPTAQHSGSPKAFGDNPDALAPNPGEEDSFHVQNNPFAFSPGQVSKLINPKSLDAFVAVGGLTGLVKGLRTDTRAGLSLDESRLDGAVSFDEAVAAGKKIHSPTDGAPAAPLQQDAAPGDGAGKGFDDRKRVFGQNILPERKSKSLLQLAWIALQDKVLILLSVAAVVSLALGLYQTFGATHHGDSTAKLEWIEGVAIIVAITIVVVVGSLNDWQKERQFRKLNEKKEDRTVKVIRSGKPSTISVHDILVGDVMLLEQGDIIPVDGIFIDGHNVSCDESSATGESDLIKKVPAGAVMKALHEDEEVNPKKLDPFIISGARVLDGVGTFLVTAVGVNSSHGKTMMSLRDDPGLTPLQLKLNILAGYIAKLGSGAGLLLLAVLTIEFLAHLPQNDDSPEEKGQRFLQILITSITIIVVAVPEGLPLAVTLALAYATKRMTKENNLVRHLQSCETMGNATVICSDKTGTLTENVMTVVAGTLGTGKLRFGDGDGQSSSSDEAEQENVEVAGGDKKAASQSATLIPMSKLSSSLDSDHKEMIKLSVAMNTTAFETEENGKHEFVGTKTETALLDWAHRCFALEKLAIERDNHPVQQLFPFNSKRKCMGAVVRLPDNKYRLFIKGAPEILLGQCTHAVADPTKAPSSTSMETQQQDEIRRTISEYASRSLRTLALAYRDFEQWPPREARKEEGSDNIEFSSIFKGLTWLGVVGIQDPVRAGVPKAVSDCGLASVSVKMVTGDNVETARAIARDCGILTEKGKVMEGVEFRRMGDRERTAIVKDLCVLARSSPEDKKILVKALRSLGEVVAVTGDGTNDAPALKSADVGFSMGITGTEVAKEASDIILMDDNFSSIVKALSWGRAINDAVKKFLQFQITVNITAVVLTFVTAVGDAEQEPVLNAVQLLWVNLIMDTFAALALATDPPTESMLHRKPDAKTAPLINTPMWKMIIGQSIYQLIVTLILHFVGPSFLNYPKEQQKTLVFNVFVFMQIFKLINSRRIDNHLNIFEGITKNKLFFLMMAIMAGGQVLIVFVGDAAFKVTRLNGPQWGISMVLGILSIPVGVLIRLVPDSWCVTLVRPIGKVWAKIPKWKRKKKTDDDEDAEQLGGVKEALLEIREDLAFLKRIKGGRINQISEVIMKPREYRERTRSRSGSRSSSRHNASPMKAALGMPGIVAASVGGLSPVERPVSNDRRTEEGGNGEEGRSN